jgi:metallo-beta-lactamase family protein
VSAGASITFLGAARTVTGSKYLVEAGAARVLVDCGLFQGLKDLRERNWQPLPLDPSRLDAVVLTHAHVDHCGYLPRLVAAGFRGRVFCTAGTAQLCRIVLPDAGRLQEEDAADANRGGYSRHRPALPLFTEADAERALGHLQPVGYARTVPVAPGVEVSFINAGHLLGSAFVRLTVAGAPPRTILFGGDLGRYDRPVLPDPSPVATADLLLLESTYGDRRHEPDAGGARLAGIVNDTVARGGRVVIPAFAIGRVEEVLYWLRRLETERRIPELPVYLDSPMAARARDEYLARLHELDAEIQALAAEGRTGRRLQAARGVGAFATARFHVVTSPEESRRLAASRTPAIVISSSGMATGGRVLHHLRAVLPEPRHTVLFVGYQAAGTRGRRLVDGEREVKIHGEFVPVRARIEAIDAMSAHADADEILRWLSGFERPPAMTYLVHGEAPAMAALQARLARELGWRTAMPEFLERVAVEEAASHPA